MMNYQPLTHYVSIIKDKKVLSTAILCCVTLMIHLLFLTYEVVSTSKKNNNDVQVLDSILFNLVDLVLYSNNNNNGSNKNVGRTTIIPVGSPSTTSISLALVTSGNTSVNNTYVYELLAEKLGTTSSMVKLVMDVATHENINPLLFLSLITTESSFDPYAKSSKSYHGLAQIPWNVPYMDINLQLGARIFKEKYRIADRDLYTAIRLYKGYKKQCTRGKVQVEKVLNLYKDLQDTVHKNVVLTNSAKNINY